MVDNTQDIETNSSWIKSTIQTASSFTPYLIGLVNPIAGLMTATLTSNVANRTVDKFREEEIKRNKKEESISQLKKNEYQEITKEINESSKLRKLLLNGIKKEPQTIISMEKSIF